METSEEETSLSEVWGKAGCRNIGNTANWNQLALLEQTAMTGEKRAWCGDNVSFYDFFSSLKPG